MTKDAMLVKSSLQTTDTVKPKLGFGRRRLIQDIIKKNWMTEDVTNIRFNINDVLYLIQEMQEEENNYSLEDSGKKKRGFYIFRDFMDYLFNRNLANYDSMVLLTSEKGTGKSSAAIMMARAWCKKIGVKFDPEMHLAYNNADVMEKIDRLPLFHPIVADEAVRFASSADWSKKESKELKKKLAQVRTKHLLYILCFPLKISKVEKNYLESFTNYWCDLFGRGLGAIYVKDKNPVNDSWRMKDFKNVGSYTEFSSLSQIESKLKKHPNFWKTIRFPKPPPWLYNKYLKVREKNIYNNDSVRSMVTTEDIHKSLLLLALQDIMMNDTTLTMNRITQYIKNTYNIPIPKTNVQNILIDAKQMITKIRGEHIV